MQILAPHISCICTTTEVPAAIAEGYKEIYIMTLKGVYKHHILRGENRYVRLKVDKIPGYTEPVIDEGMNFLPAGKIPYAIYEQVLAFFKKVMEVKVAEVEAMIHILYNPEQGYHLGVPPQTISKAAVSYDWNYLEPGTSIVVDIHSHNTMGAFFSGTDDRDDRGNISFSGVFGKLKDREPMTVWRFNYFDKKLVATAEDLFEVPVRPEVEVPDEWIDKVKVHTYTPPYKGYNTTTQGGHSNQGNVGRPVTAPGSATGKSIEDLGKWRYPTNSQTQSPAANRQANQAKEELINSPSQSGHGQTIGRTFEDTDASDDLLHFFGAELPDDYPASVSSRGVVIPTVSGPVDEIYEDFQHFNPQTGVMDRPDPDFGVNSIREDFHHGEGEADPVGKSSGELALLDEASSYTDPQYEIIAQIHGVEVADAWHSINTEMSALDGQDELNQELICDMAGLSSDEGQLKIMRALFERLSDKNRVELETHGL